MKTNIRYWQSVLQEAERELEAATGTITLKAAAKRYMRAKAEVKRLEQVQQGVDVGTSSFTGVGRGGLPAGPEAQLAGGHLEPGLAARVVEGSRPPMPRVARVRGRAYASRVLRNLACRGDSRGSTPT